MQTALARKPAEPEAPDMPPGENTELTAQVAELRSDVRHLEADTNRRFDAVDKRFDGIDKKIDDLRDQFSAFKDRLNGAKLWAISMYIGLAGGLLYIIAKVAKWL